ncbi:serpin family protein [Aquiflexum sp.]|uniref:serpin family protein n=1 Tax=Aquiflexum sp. TaxID=1872584 RepID=UPI00359418FD
MKYLSFIPFICLTYLVSCAQVPQVPNDILPNIRTLDQEEIRLVNSSSEFAMELFREIEKSEDGNYFFSPYSIHQALSMAMNGNEGEVLEEFLKVLHFEGLDLSKANDANKGLTEFLKNVDLKVAINIANAIWYRQGLSVQPPFKATMENYYGANVEALDFNQPNSHQVINNWIERETRGLIKNMLDGIPNEAIMYLVNAIYFKGDWKTPFHPSKTSKQNFYPEKSPSTQVDMMSTGGKIKVNYFQSGQLQYLELPYSTGQYNMGIVYHSEGKLSSLMPEITFENIRSWQQQSRENEMIVEMPKFKMEYKLENLKQHLMDLGLKKAFEPSPKNFTKLFENPLMDMYISRIIHQAMIEVDEKGTEAAAATVVEIGVTSMPVTPTFIRLDKPFLFFIKEKHSGTILFMGKMENPSLN